MMRSHWIELPDFLTVSDPVRLVAHEPPLPQPEFVQRSLALAGVLRAMQCQRIGLWFDDSAELACTLLACWRAGVVAVLAGDIQPATCARLNRKVDLWLSDTHLPDTAANPSSIDALLRAGAAAPLAPVRLDPATAGVLLLTSGSSGRPKLIAKRWSQLTNEVRTLEQNWPSQHRMATVAGSVSPQHMYGLPFRVLWPLCSGRPVLRRQLAFPQDIQQAILAHAPVIWISSPALLRRCENLDWSALQDQVIQVFSAGGPLPDETSDMFSERLSLRPIEIYGSSETGVIAWRQGRDDWRAFPGVTVGRDERLALWVEAPWIGRRREQTADAVDFTEAGFQLLDRVDRIIKVEEKRIALPMIERILTLHPYVREAYVGKRQDSDRLTSLTALTPAGAHALRNQGRRKVIETLQAHLASHFTSLAIPRSWRLMTHIPRTAQDKLPLSVFESLAGPRPTEPETKPLPAGEDGTLRYQVRIPFDLSFFPGHFPETPVVPGVAQIGWAYQTARRDLMPTLNFGGMEVLKFQKLLRPGDTVELALRWNADNAKLYFSFLLDGEPCSSGRILHKPHHANP